MYETSSVYAWFDGIDTMTVEKKAETAWVRMGGVSFQFTRGDDGVIEVDAYADCDGSGITLQTMKVATTTRTRVSVTVEVEVTTTAGEASEPGNVIMAAVEAVRDGEGTVVAHEIVK
jgi:hypothetical protein